MPGPLVAIGGSEDWDGGRTILREIALRVGEGRLVVCTAAPTQPRARWAEYEEVLRNVGVAGVVHLDIQSREEAFRLDSLAPLDGAAGILLTGGDQSRLMSLIGGSPAAARMRHLNQQGAMIAGTSAGAAVIGEVFVTGGSGHRSARLHELPPTAPRLSLLPGAVIEHHFSERARLGRLVGALAQHPELLGVGIDENTAIVVAGDRRTFQVIGEGAVYVMDAIDTRHANQPPQRRGTLSLIGTRLEVLAAGDAFDLCAREAKSVVALPTEESALAAS